ncbi:MAG: quinolinate synthase NadA [Candidatus Aminicenantes bacterium]|nr:quinolinate synthase NadA [Candidatus Aminicenantes bacterium]NIM85197.1 quinolinate synthase NadA [Candidatus Aminicenantes bacterium]NIN24727.1 quinolinate synthase NadA [Candidatus Aminicenantes bacterium]NIN48485.1 quinolinate synthase NadA [Candidatus Aminicenantes bacterium]NIN91385.1 quinolinate synthase NadA [Candidatus Aminicenantes bacterium]
MTDLHQEIKELKEAKNAVLLVHNYQVEEVQLAADYLGDSLDLSRTAAKVKHDMIVFAGVKFMAETAKILSPGKKVLLPRLDAGCPMADMIVVDELIELKEKHKNAKVVTYVNSSVEIKAESDVCCTSANAISVVKNIDADEIIFVPDQNLGMYVQKMVPEKKIIPYEGYCYVHNRIKREEIQEMKKHYPEAKVVVHPETRMEVIELADEVLSTNGMLTYVARSDAKEFIVGTEQGLLERMKREHPDKEFYPAFRPKICSNMKRTSLRDVYDSLKEEKYEIEIDPEIARRANKALEGMLKYV